MLSLISFLDALLFHPNLKVVRYRNENASTASCIKMLCLMQRSCWIVPEIVP